MSAKVALVTASSAGLGAACVRTLASHYRVVVNYHSRLEKAQEVVQQAEAVTATYATSSSSSQPRFHIIKGDVTKRDEIKRIVQETVDTMGRLDLVVSNAGWTRITNFMDLDDQVREEDWDRCFDVNVKSHLWLFYAAKPHLEKNEGSLGSFINVASVAGVRPSGSSLPYSVTKAAEIHLTKGLAVIAGKNVRVNSVSPGLMMTEWGAQFPASKVNASKEKSVLKNTATPEDVAEQIKCLALSNSITGQNIVIDCGIAI